MMLRLGNLAQRSDTAHDERCHGRCFGRQVVCERNRRTLYFGRLPGRQKESPLSEHHEASDHCLPAGKAHHGSPVR